MFKINKCSKGSQDSVLLEARGQEVGVCSPRDCPAECGLQWEGPHLSEGRAPARGTPGSPKSLPPVAGPVCGGGILLGCPGAQEQLLFPAFQASHSGPREQKGPFGHSALDEPGLCPHSPTP